MAPLLLVRIPPGNVIPLLPEAGCCLLSSATGRRILFAAGIDAADDTPSPRRHGLFLREETLAMVWTCMLTLTTCEPAPLSCLANLNLDGTGPEADVPPDDDGEAGVTFLRQLVAPLDEVHCLVPRSAAGFAVGSNWDDAVHSVALHGEDEDTGEACGYLLHQDVVERLWQTLLIGPGSHFATEESPYQEIFRALDREPVTDDADKDG